jgi:hypothetical protein
LPLPSRASYSRDIPLCFLSRRNHRLRPNGDRRGAHDTGHRGMGSRLRVAVRRLADRYKPSEAAEETRLRNSRLTRGGEIDFKLRRRAAWLENVGRVLRRGYRRGLNGSMTGGLWSRSHTNRTYAGANGTENLRLMPATWSAGTRRKPGTGEIGYDAVNDRAEVTEIAHNWALALL